VGDGEQFSAIGIAVIERLALAKPDGPMHVVPVVHEDIAWDTVLRHLRTFAGQVLLFAFANSDVYDAGTAEIHYSKKVRQFDQDGNLFERLSAAQRRKIWEQKAALLNRPPPPKFYTSNQPALEDAPWIFRIATPAGKIIRTAVWNGRRDYEHLLPPEALRWVGGESIAVVQVDRPVGVNRRSSFDLTHRLAKDFDSVVHWARDSETYQSILNSFVRLDLESVSPPELPQNWNPQVTLLAANT
jgi:hypothetical protein